VTAAIMQSTTGRLYGGGLAHVARGLEYVMSASQHTDYGAPARDRWGRGGAVLAMTWLAAAIAFAVVIAGSAGTADADPRTEGAA
jgi:hypothetical protein